MHRKVLLWGLVLSGIAVMLGAFGAHALKNIVPADKVMIFETGVRYQFIHALALILLSIYMQANSSIFNFQKGIGWTAKFFLLGILCFSGSLYLLTFQPLCSFPYSKILGPITPVGGLLLILGWSHWIKLTWGHKVDK
ncbi:MAG: hypothetical protein RLZ95_929 [Bacteroidota bacterium]|jgi:uncharacterized membrane protein YgdD (TMEM256/DUF423 family)